MSFRIERLTTQHEDAYSKFLATSRESLLYHSLKYRNFLRQILQDSQDIYLIAVDDKGEIVASLPFFVKSGPLGKVANSLPFYGSHGDIVASPDCPIEVKVSLVNKFTEFCLENDVVISTLISNPLSENESLYNDYKDDFTDSRIGQITFFETINKDDLANSLMSHFHVKTRNLVRKGQKSGFTISHDGALTTLQNLQNLHAQNMEKIGGTAKPWSVFEAIRNNFNYGTDYKIYSAHSDGELAASLLLFYSNQTIEYFTPVVNEKHRSNQPLSYLIYTAMMEAISEGFLRWNWGGTWLNQDGVYHFKSRWGTKDLPYKYHIKAYVNPDNLKDNPPSTLLEHYPYFYVLPFNQLVKKNT